MIVVLPQSDALRAHGVDTKVASNTFVLFIIAGWGRRHVHEPFCRNGGSVVHRHILQKE
jgi:hypothetical protein